MDLATISEALGTWAAQGRNSLAVVEDEPLIGMMIEELAADLGWDVAWCVTDEARALAQLKATQPAVAVLDINLGLTTSFAVAAACRERGIPVLFITGYIATAIPDGCGSSPVLAKPFSPEDFRIALERCLKEVA